MSMSFSAVMNSIRAEGEACVLNVTDDWLQGRSVFGGLQACLALRAMRLQVSKDLPLQTLQVTFIAPVPAGEIRAHAKVLRTGKSATHVAAEIVQDDQTLGIFIGVFGAPRSSAVAVIPQQLAVQNEKPPIPFPFLPGLTPNFTQHFSVQWLRGLPPFTGDACTEHVVSIDLRDAGPASEYHVLAIADFIPPVALSLLKKVAPGSSMTWMLEFIMHSFNQLPLDGWRVDASLVAAHDGYTSQSCMIWGPGGIPVALSRQNMVVFG